MKNEIRWPWLRLSTTTDSWPSSLPRAADLYDDQNLPPSTSLRDLLPGLLITLLGLLSAMYLSDQYGIPTTLIGLLIGLSLNFLAGHGALARGLSFASSSFLRLGIVLAGTNITIAQVVALGAPALASVAVIITIVIMSGIIFARLVGYDRAFGVLAAGAVAICGA
ncbi:MAG: putative sulfate exporter family transporter, partial [Burkholderiales bacterium]